MKIMLGRPNFHDGLGVLGHGFNHENHDTLNIPDTPGHSRDRKDTFK